MSHEDANGTVPTRILIISDTHGSGDSELISRLVGTKFDVVLHCGDLTSWGGLEEYEKTLRMLGNLKAELKLIIAGNHDVSLDKEFFIAQKGDVADHEKAIELMRGPLAQESGVTYLDEGTHSFALSNGAMLTIYTSQFQPRYGISAFQYPTEDDRFNPPGEILPWATCASTPESAMPSFPAVDVVMTHGPPKYVLDESADGSSAGCEHLRRAICRSQPLLHCFGHIHRGWGARRVAWSGSEPFEHGNHTGDEMIMMPPDFVGMNQARRKGYATIGEAGERGLVHGEQTLFVNAAIINEKNEPSNVPWLVSLRLRRRGAKSERDLKT